MPIILLFNHINEYHGLESAFVSLQIWQCGPLLPHWKQISWITNFLFPYFFFFVTWSQSIYESPGKIGR